MPNLAFLHPTVGPRRSCGWVGVRAELGWLVGWLGWGMFWDLFSCLGHDLMRSVYTERYLWETTPVNTTVVGPPLCARVRRVSTAYKVPSPLKSFVQPEFQCMS